MLTAADLNDANDYARAEKAPATRRAYGSDFEIFRAWCDAKHVLAIPAWPETVAAFLAAEAKRGVKPSTIGRRMAAIRYAHKLAGLEPPTNSEAVKASVRGIRRTSGSAPTRKAPATADKIVAMVTTARDDLRGLRDRALLLLGFAGAFRRSELVALDVADLDSATVACASEFARARPTRRGRARRSRSSRARSPARSKQCERGSKRPALAKARCFAKPKALELALIGSPIGV